MSKTEFRLLVDGQPLPDDIELSVFMCRDCDGKGRRKVTTGAWISTQTKTSGMYQQDERCKRCRGSGFVAYFERTGLNL